MDAVVVNQRSVPTALTAAIDSGTTLIQRNSNTGTVQCGTNADGTPIYYYPSQVRYSIPAAIMIYSLAQYACLDRADGTGFLCPAKTQNGQTVYSRLCGDSQCYYDSQYTCVVAMFSSESRSGFLM